MRSVLLAMIAALVFAGSAPPARAAAEAPPTTAKGPAAEPSEELEVWWVSDPKHKERKWIVIGAAAAAVALVGVLAARWARAGAPPAPPAA